MTAHTPPAPPPAPAAARDTTKRMRAVRAARRLPRFNSDTPPADATLIAEDEDESVDGASTSDLDASKDAAAAGAATGGYNVPGSAKRAAKCSDAGIVKGGRKGLKAVEAVHRAPAMADGLVVDEEEEQDLLQFKETPTEVGGGALTGVGRGCLGPALVRTGRRALWISAALLERATQPSSCACAERCTPARPSPPSQRRLRTAVFMREVIPWWLVPLGYGGLAILATVFLPMIYKPVKWCANIMVAAPCVWVIG